MAAKVEEQQSVVVVMVADTAGVLSLEKNLKIENNANRAGFCGVRLKHRPLTWL